ncbi:MAG TPA: helix-turn-helix domain-containing protein [Bacillaceae bacterium]
MKKVEEKCNMELMLDILTPKIKKSLRETDVQHREDLEQELKEKLIKKIKENEPASVPGFFDLLGKES